MHVHPYAEECSSGAAALGGFHDQSYILDPDSGAHDFFFEVLLLLLLLLP